MVAAVATASRLGILIKQVSDIELAARINAFVFDKPHHYYGYIEGSRLALVDGVKPAELLLATASVNSIAITRQPRPSWYWQRRPSWSLPSR